MVVSTTPIAGFDSEAVHAAASTFPPPHTVGATINGSDGHHYTYAEAGGAIAVDTACVFDEATGQMTAGAGDFTSNPTNAMAAGDFGWFQRTDV